MSITCLEDLAGIGTGWALVRVAAAAVAADDGPVTELHLRALRSTVEWLLDHDARVTLAAAVDGDDRGAPSFEDAAVRLAAALGRPVRFVAETEAGRLTGALGQTVGAEVALLENFARAQSDGPELDARLAAIFSHFVDDDFAGSWRRHPLLAAIADRFDREHRALGRHMQNEVDALACLMNRPDEPFVAVVGGPCLTDSMVAMDALLVKSNRVVVGGGVAAAVLNRMGLTIGCPTMTDRCQVAAGELLAGAGERRARLVVPGDLVVETASGAVATVTTDAVPAGAVMLDIGPRSRDTAAAAIADARTVFWYGSMGRDRDARASAGSAAVAMATAAGDSYSVVAGNEALRALSATPHAAEISHLCTGGMAALLFIADQELPGLAAMED